MDIVLRCVAFRDDRPLLGLGIEPLAEQCLCEIARPARKLVVTLCAIELLAEVAKQDLCRAVVSGEELDVAEQSDARGQRCRPKTQIIQDCSGRSHERAAFVEASGLRDQAAEERPQIRSSGAIGITSVEVAADPVDGLIDRRGAPVERRSDLSKAGRGRPAGCPVLLDSLHRGVGPRAVVTAVTTANPAGEQPCAPERSMVGNVLEDRDSPVDRVQKRIGRATSMNLDVRQLEAGARHRARIAR